MNTENAVNSINKLLVMVVVVAMAVNSHMLQLPSKFSNKINSHARTHAFIRNRSSHLIQLIENVKVKTYFAFYF